MQLPYCPEGSYFFEMMVEKGGVIRRVGVIRGMGSYYFESVILPESLHFLFEWAFHMTMQTELASGNSVLQHENWLKNA